MVKWWKSIEGDSMVSRIGLVSFLFRVQLITCKFTFKNLKEFILQNYFLTNPKLHAITSSCWLKSGFKIICGIARIHQWFQKFFYCLTFTKRQLLGTFLILNMDHRMTFTFISLGRKAIHFCPSPWFPISRMQILSKHF